MAVFLLAVLALISFTEPASLRSKRGSYGAPSNYSPPEGQFGSSYGQNAQYGQNYGTGGGGYGRPGGSYGRPDSGYNRPQQFGSGGYPPNANYPGAGFPQGGPGGFQGSNVGPGGFQGSNIGPGGFQGDFQGARSGAGFQGGQNGFAASPPSPSVPSIPSGVPPPAPGGVTDPDYSTVGQKAPVAAPGAADSGLFGGAAASSGFDDPALAADTNPVAGKTTADSVAESSSTGRRK